MEDFLSAALLFLFLGGTVFSWLDWRRRMRRLGTWVGPSWACPNCSVVNEAVAVVCWSCGAGIAGRAFGAAAGNPAETWRCGKCAAWNAKTRRACWSCAHAPTKAPKRPA